MNVYNPNPSRLAGEAIARNKVLTIRSDGKWYMADATDVPVAAADFDADVDEVLSGSPLLGERPVIAGASVTAGNPIYVTADGEVTPTSVSNGFGIGVIAETGGDGDTLQAILVSPYITKI